jgi:hypothetical protein
MTKKELSKLTTLLSTFKEEYGEEYREDYYHTIEEMLELIAKFTQI